MTLTEREVLAVRKSWTKLSANGLEIVGIVILQGLLNKSPETRDLFQRVGVKKNMPEILSVNDLLSMPKLKEHSQKLAETIDLVVANLTNTEVVVKACTEIGEVHLNYGVNYKHVDLLGPILLDVIAVQLKIESNDFIIKSWAKAYGVIASCFKTGLNM